MPRRERVGGSEGVLHRAAATYCAERGVARRSARTRAPPQGRSRSRRSRCRPRPRPHANTPGAARASLSMRRPPSVVVIAGHDLDRPSRRRAARPARPRAARGLDHLADRAVAHAVARDRSSAHLVPGARARLARGPLHDVDLRPGARARTPRRRALRTVACVA